MSDKMRPIAFERLLDWIFTEYADNKTIFGVAPAEKYIGNAPFGPAAGPHTQLAQNIVAAYVAGSRFFELKTVQTLDGEDLPVAKPCISAADECYNVEWSTELYVPQAMEEYIKAYYAIKLIARELHIGDGNGFRFNMSVGYDYEGIRSEKIDSFIEGLKNAEQTQAWKSCREAALKRGFDVTGISQVISDSITLSTLHGCPPHEIERIAAYLLTEKRLNTFIKCNPTLLGYEKARNIMDSLGYDYLVFDDHHFKADLQIEDAVPMLKRLETLAVQHGVKLGVKITNTLPVGIGAGELPGEEMYMSGRALFPLSIHVAKMLSQAFDGKLRISYSGGADAYNIRKLYEAGIWPITMATTLLKPGGYTRLRQVAEIFADCGIRLPDDVDIAAVEALAAESITDNYYRKPVKPLPSRKLNRHVPLVDCFTAPCRGGCPIEQDIPAYMKLVSEGKYAEALEIILQRNPLPFITGTICSHRCMDKCTRNFYDSGVFIRGAKLAAAQQAFSALDVSRAKYIDAKKVAVIGAGAAGLSAAYFLARSGIKVVVFEKRPSAGGVVRYVIPSFRISDSAIDNDVAIVKAMGAEFVFDTEIKNVSQLWEQGFTHIIIATGAWSEGSVELEYGNSINALDFLQRVKSGQMITAYGTDIAVIGGGNTAMDVARAAKRVPGVKNARLIYRRTKRYIPADEEELALALNDGVEFCELLSPIGVKDGTLTCTVMELGAPDASGRRSPQATGKTVDIPATAVIAAVGERIDTAFFTANGIELTANARVKVNPETLETSVKGVYIAGDAQSGPATVVEAIAGATRAVGAITKLSLTQHESDNINPDYTSVLAKKGRLCFDCEAAEGERCLECPTVCENCVDVCPNRANVAVAVPGKRQRQIVHFDGMCNECGNCATFCPYDSAPYKDKFTLFWSEEDFADSKNDGFLPLNISTGLYKVRLDGVESEWRLKEKDVDEIIEQNKELCDIIRAVAEQHKF